MHVPEDSSKASSLLPVPRASVASSREGSSSALPQPLCGKKVVTEITKIITKGHWVLAVRGSSAAQGAKQRLAPSQLRTRRWEEITPLSRHAARRRWG